MTTKVTGEQNGGSSSSSVTQQVEASIKDSPAVERALARSKLYLLLSWSYLYPEDDEFLDYLQSGELVEDGRAALKSLKVALSTPIEKEAKRSYRVSTII